jgi:hypothetical protein
MRLRLLVAAALTLAFAAHAGAGDKKSSLPKPYSPILDETGKEDRKADAKKQHPQKYFDQFWGANYERWLLKDVKPNVVHSVNDLH